MILLGDIDKNKKKPSLQLNSLSATDKLEFIF